MACRCPCYRWISSGLNADTGCAMGAVVRASRTLTFIGIKRGLLTADGVDCVGRLDCDPSASASRPGGRLLLSASIIPPSTPD